MAELGDWLDVYLSRNYICYAKRLSGNDTLANGTHQAGPYIPKEVLLEVFSSLNQPERRNPDVWFDLHLDSHAGHRNVRAVWYNNKLHDNPTGGRNETRLTNFGGASSALLDPESTGALAVFAFGRNNTSHPPDCHVWVCRQETEEEAVEDRIGPVEPGQWRVWISEASGLPLFAPTARTNCRLDRNEIPAEWLTRFPSGEEIIRKAVELRPDHTLDADHRLVRRRACEFEMFRSIEKAFELPSITAGFHDIDQFIARAQTILQRRKSRSGRSLELHTRQLLLDEGMKAGTDFEHQPESESGKRPDFLFPSGAAYRDSSFPADRLRMLAVKTTCRDRWRQILNEADRVSQKHLLTLQEGISEGQFREMTDARVQLVVPAALVESFPEAVRPHLQTIESFIADVRLLMR